MNESLFSGDKVFSVSEINSLLKDMLENSFPQICIEGEISNYRPNSSGHLYFTLKDEASQISAVMFRSAAAHIDFVPKDGTSAVYGEADGLSCAWKLSDSYNADDRFWRRRDS